jgi:hypothetical protein
MFIKEIAYSYPLEVSLSGFGMSVILASENEFPHFYTKVLEVFA